QMTMPKSRSLWPSIPRKETWERSGSLRLASPPASSARAEPAPSKVRTATAPNLVNLQLRNQAFASQVSIHDPPLIIHSKGDHKTSAPYYRRFRHTFSPERRWARAKHELFTFHQEEAVAPTRDYA